MWQFKPALVLAAIGTLLVLAGKAWAGPAPVGLWIDHTGRGGVEITRCGQRLCGHIAWLKDGKNAEACGIQIIGDAKPMRNGTWDRGWIYDPDANSKYDVELKPIGSQKLRVMGYAGTKFLSETMIWKRAPIGLTKCRKPGSAKAATAPENAVSSGKKATKQAQAAVVKVKSEGASPRKVRTAAKPETKSKGTLAKVIKAAVADTNKDGGKSTSRSKRTCRFSVPYLNMVVKVPCDS